MQSAYPNISSRNRPISGALIGFIGGTALQLQQTSLFSWGVYGLLVLTAFAVLTWVLLKDTANRSQWVLMGLAFCLMAFGLTGLRASGFSRTALDPALEGRDLVLTGVVAAMPQASETSLRFRLNVESARFNEHLVRVPPRIYLGWYSGSFDGARLPSEVQLPRSPAKVIAGERWQFTVRLKAPHGASNPFGFDYELWLWEQGLQASGSVRSGAKVVPPKRLGQTGWYPVERVRQHVRESIFQRVADRQLAGLIAALAVGDQNAIERADWNVFRATGVSHLMSISGLHITMFAWVAALLVGRYWRRSGRLCLWVPASSAALVGGVMLAAAYALFSGWGVPSQRTVLMLATVGLLRLSGKSWPWPHVWLLAGVAVLALDPWALLQSGFWLSFVAVGVLFASDSGMGCARVKVDPDSTRRMTAMVRDGANTVATNAWGMFHQQWVITLALTPLTLLLFGQVSVVGLAANALAIPWVTLVITPLALLGVVAAPLWDIAALAVGVLVGYLHLLATLPFATISVAQAPLWAGVAGVFGGVLLALQMPWSVRAMGVPLILPVLFWQAPRPAVGHFELLAADVGQGNAVLIRTANHALVYDTGPRYSQDSDAGDRVVAPLLRAYSVTLDKLVLSHRDIDHVGGAPAVLAMQPKAELLSSIEDGHELLTLRRGNRCEVGQRWTWDGVNFEVLHPHADDYVAVEKSNAMSCVLRVTNGKQSALLAGDIESAQEMQMVDAAVDLKSDVLLVPHHGSKTSSSDAFLDAVQPQIALVQSGYRNRYGHPAESILGRYEQRGIRVFDSPHCGAATWRSAQPFTLDCHRLSALRYWHHKMSG
jgi:competence protein ComEC